MAASLLLTFNHLLSTAFAQGTAFTYQGQLQNTNGPVHGTYNFNFSLFNTNINGTAIAGPVTVNGVVITNGLFTVAIDFSASVWNGQTNWLQIAVETNGASSFTNLSPRQQLTPTPYAIFANTASNVLGTVLTEQLSGTLPLAQLPGAVVTNNEASVTLSNVTLSGVLTLPSAGTIDSGGNSLLYVDGAEDLYAGLFAGNVAFAATDNTGIGYGSLSSNSNGVNNTAIGYLSLNNNTNGSFNVATGGRALFSNTSGNNNTAVGRRALENNTSGSDNTAEGYEALSGNPGGSNNIALGYLAGSAYGNYENSNIDIGNPGVGGDNNLIRIGSGQTSTFIAGVINGNGGGLTNLSAVQVTGPLNLQQIALLKWGVSQADNTFGVGTEPLSICFDGASIWVADTGANNVTKLSASTGGTIGAYSAEAQPYAICFDGSCIWVAGINGNYVTKLNASTGAIIGNYQANSSPDAICFDGANIWVANYDGGSVTQIAASNGGINQIYAVGTAPDAICFDGANIWVANSGDNTVTKLNDTTGATIGTYSVGSGPFGICFDGANIWVANHSGNTVTKLNARTGATIGTYSVGSEPAGICFDGASIWVANYGANTVTKLNDSTGATIGTYSVGSEPIAICFDGASIWVANSGDNTVTKL